MKRLYILLSLIGIATLGLVATTTARAETVPLSEEHIARIKMNCVDAQSNMNQLHAYDALLRVNRGQLYELISVKLMAPFNSRLVLNRLDSLNLVPLTVTYDRQLATFRTDYQQYEQAISKALAIDCVKQPTEFYNLVVDARNKRKQTYDDVVLLQKTIEDYRNEVALFGKNIQPQEAK